PMTKHLATFALVPWGEDEQIEYLLAVARERCGPVMSRVKAAADRGWFGGSPELWRIVLDRMVADPAIDSVRDALRRELASRLTNDWVWRLVTGVCLSRFRKNDDDAVALVPGALVALVSPDAVLSRLVAHRPIQLLGAADAILNRLADGGSCVLLDDQ